MFPQHQFDHATSEAEAVALVPGADVAFMAELRPAHFSAARHLRWIHSSAAGVGNMLFPELVQSDVVLTNSSGVSADPIAEHVLGLTLALFRKFPAAFRSQASRHWAQNDMVAPPPLRHVQGTHVLIVGLGSIGAACAWRFAALGAEVYGNSPAIGSADAARRQSCRQCRGSAPALAAGGRRGDQRRTNRRNARTDRRDRTVADAHQCDPHQRQSREARRRSERSSPPCNRGPSVAPAWTCSSTSPWRQRVPCGPCRTSSSLRTCPASGRITGTP